MTGPRPYDTMRGIGSQTPRPDRSAALRIARRRFLRSERFDVSAVAEELGVNRVTLYRWFGTRDALLVETLWSLADFVLTTVAEKIHGRGPDRIIELAGGFLEVVLNNPGMRHWLAEDGEHAMRLLTRHDMPFQPRLIAAFEDVLQGEVAAGTLALPVDSHELAFVVVRLIETYSYLDLITGEQPDPSRIRPILGLLLHS
jgi:AcrR family transcriptional regulator